MHGSALDCDWSTVSALTTIVFQSRSTVWDLHTTFYSPVKQPQNPELSYILIHQGLVYLNDGFVIFKVCFLYGRHDSGIEGIHKVSLLSPDCVISWCQQDSIPTLHSVSRALLSTPESYSDSLPDSPQGWPLVLFYILAVNLAVKILNM